MAQQLFISIFICTVTFMFTAGIAAKLEATGINVAQALIIGAYAKCRGILDNFADNFRGKHKGKEYQELCDLDITDLSTTATLRHFEECSGVWHERGNIFDGSMCAELDKHEVRAPSGGSLADVFKELSSKIHEASLMVTEKGKIVIPAVLPSAEKRLLVRFIKAKGNDVIMLTSNGLREPDDDEIHTPEKIMGTSASPKKRTSFSPPKEHQDAKVTKNSSHS